MKGFFGSKGKYYTGPQRMAMFSMISQRKMRRLMEDDPKEHRISDRIATVVQQVPAEVNYQRGEFAVLTGSPRRGGMVHLHLLRGPENMELPFEDGIEYVVRK